MSRAAIYVRISRDREGAGLGVQRQETDCRELATKHNLTVAQVYCDNDLSAYSGKARPEYKRLIDDIAGGRIDAVLAWHTDRLHRSPTELEKYISVCEPRGVPTLTAKAGPLDLATPSGRLVARQLGAVARYEVDHQVERQRSAKLQAATAGRWGGGRRPYGFEDDGVTVRPDEAKVVSDATDQILLGASLRGQAAALNARGLTTSTGRQWKATELRRVLTRARNAGLREHKGEVIGPAEWPAIVDEERWRAVCGALSDPGRRTSWSSYRRWMLSGVARCGVCGETLRVTLLESTRSSVPSYCCKANKCVVRNARELDDYVSDLVIERLSRPDAIDLLQHDDGPDMGLLRVEINTLRQRLDDLAGFYADGSIDARQLAAGSERLQGRLKAAEEAMAEAGRRSVLSGLVDATDVEIAWKALEDLDRRSTVIDTLMAITVHRTKKGRPAGWRPGSSYFNPSTIEITWKN
jgi:site-specific DNA recombinase